MGISGAQVERYLPSKVMPSRRKSIELSESEIDEYLQTAHTLIIVSNGPRGFPHPMPMWFYADSQRNCYCTTFAKSQKVLNWKRDPRASLLVESGEQYAELKGLVIYAQTEVIEDLASVIDTLVNINAKGRNLTEEQRQGLRQSVSSTAAKRIVLKFVPEKFISWDHAKLGGRY